MAVDLGDLVDSLKYELNPPGQDLFPTTTSDEWVGRLASAFWNARIEGFLAGYVEVDGAVLPVEDGDPDMPRELQQVIVFLAAYNAIMLRLQESRTALRLKAGPTEYESESSANMLRDRGQYLRDRYLLLLRRLSDVGDIPSYVIDAVVARQDALVMSGRGWIR